MLASWHAKGEMVETGPMLDEALAFIAGVIVQADEERGCRSPHHYRVSVGTVMRLDEQSLELEHIVVPRLAALDIRHGEADMVVLRQRWHVRQLGDARRGARVGHIHSLPSTGGTGQALSVPTRDPSHIGGSPIIDRSVSSPFAWPNVPRTRQAVLGQRHRPWSPDSRRGARRSWARGRAGRRCPWSGVPRPTIRERRAPCE